MTHSPSSPGAASPAQCSRCGAPLAEHQRYCLNCGARVADSRVPYETLLQAAPGGEPVLAPVLGAAPPAVGPRTLSPLGAAAGIGLLLFAVLVGATIGGRDDSAAAQPVVLAQSTTPAPTTATVSAFTSDWTGGDGWTVQLQVLPRAGTTPQQVADAKAAATAAGATDVGAVDSSAYPTLPPDSYVIYSGRFDDKAAAKAARKALTPSFPDAKLAKVAATATEDAAAKADESKEPATKTSDGALEDLKKSSSEDYVKKSKKLPDEVGTEGEAPPVDDAAPGGGSEEAATEIG